MILIDDKKTIIAGEALKVMAELGMVVDRLLLELSNKGEQDLEYEELLDRFEKMLLLIKKVRGSRDDMSPQEVFYNAELKDIFPEDFFKSFHGMETSGPSGQSRAEDSQKDASELLKEAMAKLNKSKEKAKKKKKKNKE
jgi:hypothetical protein